MKGSLGMALVAIESTFPWFSFSGSDVISLTFLEFGNQLVHDWRGNTEYPLFKKYKYKPTYSEEDGARLLYGLPHEQYLHISVKPFFEFLGFSYTSVDYNGKDGALPLDVRVDLRANLTTSFNIITNIGFSEHIGEFDIEDNLWGNQYAMFQNFHNLGHIGTLYFHEVPAASGWFLHGVCGYELSFFRELIQLNNYQTQMLFSGSPHGKRYTLITVAYEKKNSDDFMTFEAFQKLPGLKSRFPQIHVVQYQINNNDIQRTRNLVATEDAIAIEARDLCHRRADNSQTCIENLSDALSAILRSQHSAMGRMYGLPSSNESNGDQSTGAVYHAAYPSPQLLQIAI